MIGVLIIFFLALISIVLITLFPEAKAPPKKIEAILAVLPHTQCGQCHYSGCRPYAEAIVQGKAYINQCPPGGKATVKVLADLLGCQAKPLNRLHGSEKVAHIAVIDETLCIGCVKCIKACPTDAIIGAARQMHSVIAEECTGCELCLAPCPMDCISLRAVAT